MLAYSGNYGAKIISLHNRVAIADKVVLRRSFLLEYQELAWPTPQDYNEAIQSPNICFSDDELREGRIEQDVLGLPRPITGAFASVYRVTTGDADWAVRCFLRYTADLQLRYAALSEFIVNDDLEFTAPFHYLTRGIFINGSWYPILKMQWVEGETLDCYVRKYCYEPEKLLWLATAFAKMISEMNVAGIAHGDLQHGNILVGSSSLMLVDYDGMFIPKLMGWSSHELGHRNYQHPLRTANDFGPPLDNFSANLIYWSLRILACYPFPDDLLNYQSEALIFSRTDLSSPEASPAFRFLEHHENFEIACAAKYLRSLLNYKCMEVPPLVTDLPEGMGPSELPPMTHDEFVKRESERQKSFAPIAEILECEEDEKIPADTTADRTRSSVYSQLAIDYRSEFGVPYLAKKWAERKTNLSNQLKIDLSAITRRKYYAAGQAIINRNFRKVRFYIIDRRAVGRSFSLIVLENGAMKALETTVITNWKELTPQEQSSVLLNARIPTAAKLYMSIDSPSEPVVLVMESGLPLWLFDFCLCDPSP